jgi:hypothetical protein
MVHHYLDLLAGRCATCTALNITGKTCSQHRWHIEIPACVQHSPVIHIGIWNGNEVVAGTPHIAAYGTKCPRMLPNLAHPRRSPFPVLIAMGRNVDRNIDKITSPRNTVRSD